MGTGTNFGEIGACPHFDLDGESVAWVLCSAAGAFIGTQPPVEARGGVPMKIDLYTKAVLTVIAVALCAIAARPMLASPAFASDSDVAKIADELRSISVGFCKNKKIC